MAAAGGGCHKNYLWRLWVILREDGHHFIAADGQKAAMSGGGLAVMSNE
jgi:hypothetical protein